MKLLITTQAIDKNNPILGFFHRWVEEFAKHFEHIHVICLYEGEHSLPANVTVYSLGKETGENRIKYIWRFYKIFSKIFFGVRVDFVFFHMGAIYNILAAPFFFLRKIINTKFYWWKTHGKLNILGRVASLWVDVIATAGDKSFDMLSRKVKVVGHAIDTDIFNFPSEFCKKNKSLGLIMVGRVVPIKKCEIAINVFKEFKIKSYQEIFLDIYGPITDLLYKKKLDDLITKTNIQQKVVFKGAVNHTDLVGVYHEYDVLIHPTYEAGFDKVVLEAVATGVIPLTSIPSFKSILEPYGLYIEKNNIDEYVNMLSKIHKMPSQEKMILLKKLRDIVCLEHSINTLPKRIFGVV